MSVRESTYYTIDCDWPGCGANADEGSDYSAWAEESSALDSANGAGWWVSRDGTKHYCGDGEHVYQWASDLNDGLDNEPVKPYLLIHDGDTDNPDDDGKVTLVLDVEASELPSTTSVTPATAST